MTKIVPFAEQSEISRRAGFHTARGQVSMSLVDEFRLSDILCLVLACSSLGDCQ